MEYFSQILMINSQYDDFNQKYNQDYEKMLKKIFALSLLGIGASGYYEYQSNHSFRSVCNLAYAGANMAWIYKFSNNSSSQNNLDASIYLRDALKKNGGIYLKLGQLIATLDVIVPDQYRKIMSTLTRQCEISPYSDIKATVEEELGYPIQVVFNKFQEKPISSASIAQVHKAQLLNGQEVAVKVQHRQLAQHVRKDLQLMNYFVNIAQKLFPNFNYKWLVQQFEKNIKLELNFVYQAANMKRTQKFLIENNFKNIYVPHIYLKPTERVLIMEFIDGLHIDRVEQMKKIGINTKEISKAFSKMIIKMIHKEGFVHADTHCGNLLVRKLKNKKDQLVLLDHGLYQEMDRQLVRNYNQFWLGLILNDPKHYEPAAKALGTSNPTLLLLMLTSKTNEEFNNSSRNKFDLNPSQDRAQIMRQATQNHEKIVKVLNELKREVLLLLKVNEFARTIQNMMSGRQMGVYQDIASECVQNMNFSFITKWKYYLSMFFAHY